MAARRITLLMAAPAAHLLACSVRLRGVSATIGPGMRYRQGRYPHRPRRRSSRAAEVELDRIPERLSEIERRRAVLWARFAMPNGRRDPVLPRRQAAVAVEHVPPLLPPGEDRRLANRLQRPVYGLQVKC